MAKPADQTSVEKLAGEAKTALDDLSKKIEKSTPTVDEFVQTLNTHTKTAATSIQGMVNKLKDEAKVHQPEVNAYMEKVQKKLEEAATNLQNAVGPDATAKAKQLQTTFETNLDSTVAELKKFANEVQPKLKSKTHFF